MPKKRKALRRPRSEFPDAREIEEALVSAVAKEKQPRDVALLLRRLASIEDQLLRERDKSGILASAIRETVAALPPAEPFRPVKPKGSHRPHVAMLDLSDVHVGDYVDPALTGGMSEYNFSIFQARGERLRSGFDSIVGIHRQAYPVNELYVNLLGDIVTGEAIYKGQSFQIDMPLLKQVFEGGYWLANLLRDFARMFPVVHVRAVAGNHGRGYEKGMNHPRTNWDIGVYELLKVLMADHKNVDFEIAETSYLIYHVPGHERFRHALIHGDQARSWMGIPFYGFDRAGNRLSSMSGLILDYVHAGHHHNEAKWPNNRVKFLINGSWVGGSDLSVNRLFRSSQPTQNLFFCHPVRGVVAAYEIQLDEWMELQADTRGVYKAKERVR